MRHRARVRVAACLVLVLAGASTAQETAGAELKKEVKKLLRLRKFEAQGRLGPALLYVEKLRAEGKESAALRYLRRIVKLDPSCLEAQLALAEALNRSRRRRAARQRATRLLQEADTDAVRAGAMRLLGQEPDLTAAPLGGVPGTGRHVVLIPFPPASVLLLKEVKRALEEELSLPIVIQQASLELPNARRNPMKSYLDTLRSYLRGPVVKEQVDAVLKALGRSRDDLASDEAVLAVYPRWLERQGLWKELVEHDRQRRELDTRQWHADDVLNALWKQAARHWRAGVYYIAVTSADIYLEDLRFVFSCTGRYSGVVSYACCRGRKTGEKPEWGRLVDRTVKCVMCVFGRLSGIRRCPRRCVNSYATGLTSLDAKPRKYCAQCRRRMGLDF